MADEAQPQAKILECYVHHPICSTYSLQCTTAIVTVMLAMHARYPKVSMFMCGVAKQS